MEARTLSSGRCRITTLREIIFLAQHEKICHLDDFLLRRSMLAMLGHVTREKMDELADVSWQRPRLGGGAESG